MFISEYSEPVQALSNLKTQDSIMKNIIKTAFDTVLITSYVVGLVSVMPVLLACSWAKENWFVQA